MARIHRIPRGGLFFSAVLVIVMLSILTQASPATITPEWVFTTSAPMLSSPKTADLDGDHEKEIILTTYAPGPDPYAYGLIFVLDAEGNALPGWPIQTTGPIPATAAVGDLDGDGIPEIVVGDWDQIHILEPDGTEFPGWPRNFPATQAAALEDLDNDDDLEILYPSNHLLYIFHHDGTLFPGWPKPAPDKMGSPGLADVDGDDEVEIVAGTFQGPVGPETYEVYAWNLDGSILTGFPFTTSGVNKVPPALGDIDDDGDVEIIIPSYHTSDYDFLYALDGTGTLEPGWPVRAKRIRLSPPALADTDGDGDLEIFIGGGDINPIYGLLYGFEHDGSALPGFPVTLSLSQVNSGPCVVDVDGDTEELEVLIKNMDTFYMYHTDGTPVPGFPFFLDDQSHTGTTSPTPCFDDLDGDGDLEAILAATFSQVALIDFPDAVDPSYVHWPCYKQDPYNRSFFGTGSPSSTPEVPLADGLATFRVWPNPASTSVSLRLRSPGGRQEVAVLDASGRRVRRIAVPTTRGEVLLTWDGRDDQGRPVASGIYTLLTRSRGTTESRRVIWIR